MFKYLLRINENKYPEVVQKLEQAKQKDSIALYIRQLVERDVQQQLAPLKQFNPVMSEIAASHEDWPKPEIKMIKKSEPKPKAKQSAINIDLDFAGGLE